MKHTKTPKNEYKFVFIILLLSLLLSLFSSAGVTTFAQAQSEQKQVLYINSYHPGYKFSDDIQKGITTAFQEQGGVTLRIEYLDTKRFSSPEYLEEINQLFKLKYKDADLDLVISSDDAALNFLFQNADALFPNVPVVFVGANYFDETRLKGYERFTGISEEADLRGTIDLALGLHPGVRNIVVVNDTSVTGKNIDQEFERLIPQYPQITFEFLEDVTMDEIRQRIGSLSQDSLVLLTIFSKDKAGTFFEYDQFTPLVAESSSVPVYGAWDFSLGYGIVGGKLTSGQIEGERAAKLALRILEGEDPANIPVDKQVKSQYMFDYKVMEKWGVEVSSLPKDSIILDRPVSFYEQNMGFIWGVLIGFILLISIIVLLAINNNQRRMVQAELAASNRELKDIQGSLEQRVTARTRALATSTEVSRRLSTILDREELVTAVVNQVREAFGYYHVQIYFYDEARENLVMAGGTGEAGKALLERGHKIPRGRGLVGRAAEMKEVILAPDTSQEPDWLPNPLLPETRSEIAVPIAAGGQVVGVLDVQNNTAGSLGQEDADLILTVADQVAIAAQNARLYAETETSKSRVQAVLDAATQLSIIATDANGLITVFNTGSERILGYSSAEMVGRHTPAFILTEEEMAARSRELTAEFGRPVQGLDIFTEYARHGRFDEREWIYVRKDGARLTVLLIITAQRNQAGEITGYLGVGQDITERKRLQQLTVQRAEQQEAINQITQKIQSTGSIEMALQVAARELGRALGMKPTLVTLKMDAAEAQPADAQERGRQ